MFKSGPKYSKLKINLRMAISRLKLLELKKTELAQKSKKEIADYLAGGKVERAKIRVEYIIREDYLVEAMELVELYCDLLLGKFGLIQEKKVLDEGLAESISSLIWVAPQLCTDVAELKVIAHQLKLKYGEPYSQACREGKVNSINERLMHKLAVHTPPKILVENYLVEIAKIYKVKYEPDPQVMRASEFDGRGNGISGAGATGGFGMNIFPTGSGTYNQNTSGQTPFGHPQTSTAGHQIPSTPDVSNSIRNLPKSYVPSVFLTNPQSLTNCFPEFRNKIAEFKPDVAAVSETWFSSTRPAENFKLSDYDLFNDDREEGRGGGVAIYIKRTLQPYKLAVDVPPELECIWAGIGHYLFICALYNPPRAPSGKLLMEHIVNTILDLKQRIPLAKVIIIGDFNNLPHERLYSSLLMQNLVLEPTHQNSAIDLILTNTPHLFSIPRILAPIGSSRHHCVLVLPTSNEVRY